MTNSTPPLDRHEQAIWQQAYAKGWDDRDWSDDTFLPGWLAAIVLGLLFGFGILIGRYLQ